MSLSVSVTTNVPDFNHHKGTKTLRTPSISNLFLSLWLRVLVVSSRATLVVTMNLRKDDNASDEGRRSERRHYLSIFVHARHNAHLLSQLMVLKVWT